MKTVFAVLIAVSAVASTLPALASEPVFVLRGDVKVAFVRSGVIDRHDGQAAVVATPAKKVRLVLASPYGN